jgi:hypothetical protein
MGLVVVLAVLALIAVGATLFIGVVRENTDGKTRQHGWLVVVPLIVVAGWFIEQLIVGG